MTLFSFFLEGYEPAHQRLEHTGVQGIDDSLSFAFIGYQVGVLKNAKMSGYTGLGNIKLSCDLIDAEIVFLQHFQDPSSGGIRQGFETVVEWHMAS
jgi:hypothetical protein